jgi:pimeloyl-ACP methyl ester carboxylesterase
MAVVSEQVSIDVGGERISGTLFTPPNSQTVRGRGILFVHGWGGTQEQCLPEASAIAELGCACLTFDLRGHGLTKDQREIVSREDNLSDLIAAYDWLAKHPTVRGGVAGVVGYSYGGYLAAILTGLRPMTHLALQAPALYRDFDWLLPKVRLHDDPGLVLYRQRVVDQNDDRALRACAAYRGHVLIVESQYDAIVPHPVVESYTLACAQARTLRTHLLKNADHALSEERWRQEYTSVLTAWISQTMVQASDL